MNIPSIIYELIKKKFNRNFNNNNNNNIMNMDQNGSKFELVFVKIILILLSRCV